MRDEVVRIGSGTALQRCEKLLAGLKPCATSVPIQPVRATGRTIALAWRHDDARMYVAEQTGTIRIVNPNGTLVSTPVITIVGWSPLIGLGFWLFLSQFHARMSAAAVSGR